jgi:transcriptional regulator
VARANPVWREARADADSLVVFQGAQAYISPGWYPSKAEHGKVVPTWNYCSVQGRGVLRVIDDAAWVHAFVTRLTQQHESTQARPWAVSDAPADYVEGLLRAIVGVELTITRLEGKWKASQNKGEADRQGVGRGLLEAGQVELARLVDRGTKRE